MNMSKQRYRVLMHYNNCKPVVVYWSMGVGLIDVHDGCEWKTLMWLFSLYWQGRWDFDYVMCHLSSLISGKCPAPHLQKNTMWINEKPNPYICIQQQLNWMAVFIPCGMPCPFSRPRGFDGVLQSSVGSLRSTRSISTALKKATDCMKQQDSM